MHVTYHARVKAHIPVTSHVVTVWRNPRAPSPQSEFPAPSAIVILGAKLFRDHRLRRIRNPFVNVREIALRVGPS